MCNYLLDTNCFYDIANNENKQKILASLSPKPSTSIIAVLELFKVSEKDFDKRKKAIIALKTIGTKVLTEDPLDIFRRAFDLPPLYKSPINIDKAIQEITTVNSYEDYKKMNPEFEEIRTMKDEGSNRFTDTIVNYNKIAIDVCLKNLKLQRPNSNPNRNEQELKKYERKLKKVATNNIIQSCDQLFSRNIFITGLSICAGLITYQEMYDASSKYKTIGIHPKAIDNYNGLLDSYVSMRLAFHKIMFTPGYNPERNASFDLDFFLHLDAHNIKYIFVTNENFWIELAKEALPGRVIHLDTLLNTQN